MATRIETETLLDTLEKRLDRMEYGELIRVYGRLDRMQLRIVQRMGRCIDVHTTLFNTYGAGRAADELLKKEETHA